MCGIIGYTGYKEVRDKLISGLEILEYRGYDSVGIATSQGIIKTVGRVEALKEELKKGDSSKTGIGHTRWATHGGVTDINAHPHKVGKITLVHNGIIENYKEIRKKLATQGQEFLSETDTEVSCALINTYFLELKDIREAIKKACSEFKGSYAFAIMVEDEPDKLYAIRYKSPLVIGKSKDGYYISSDINALIPFTKKYYRMKENELICIDKDSINIYFSKISTPLWELASTSTKSTKKQGFEHYMLKEMYEQPQAIKDTALPRIKDDEVDFSEDGIEEEYFEGVESIDIIGCGSAMHAGLIGKRLIERYAKIPVSVYVASEYRYNPPIMRKNTLSIFISQSGETADTIASLEYANDLGGKTLAIVNARETTIAREANRVIYTNAGVEIAVATTKGYTTQICVLLLIAIKLSKMESEEKEKLLKELCYTAPKIMKETLENNEECLEIAKKIYNSNHIFYMGRGIDYDLALEASLKLKEISYIHTEAYPSGELKHGTISLIEENTPVIAVSTEDFLYEKLISNLKEVKSRGAYTILIGSKEEQDGDCVINLHGEGKIERLFSLIMVIQKIAYEVSKLRGCDIDKPRNLAKSVTVE